MTTSTSVARRRKRRRAPSVLEQLISGCDAERVAVHFLDGTVREGALLYNAIKQSGKLINIDDEFSLDFEPANVKSIKVLKRRESGVLDTESSS